MRVRWEDNMNVAHPLLRPLANRISTEIINDICSLARLHPCSAACCIAHQIDAHDYFDQDEAREIVKHMHGRQNGGQIRYHIQNVKPMMIHFAQWEASSQSKRTKNNSCQPSTVHHWKGREKPGPHVAPTGCSCSVDGESGPAYGTSSVTACVPMRIVRTASGSDENPRRRATTGDWST